MLDAVEKFRQVHVDAVPITGTDVGLHLLRCSLGRAAWSKAETRFRESGVENRREDLQDGLLNQAVDHVWYPEVSLTAIRFGNRLASGRTRLVSPFQELPSNLRPLRAEGLAELVQGKRLYEEARNEYDRLDRLSTGIRETGRITIRALLEA